MKDFRVFVLDIEKNNQYIEELDNEFTTPYSMIESFENLDHDKVAKEKFIALCEEQGSVYSIVGFQNQFNDAIDNSLEPNNSFIYITNNY